MRKSNRNDSASMNRGSQLFQTIYHYYLFLLSCSLCFMTLKGGSSIISVWVLVLNNWTVATLIWNEERKKSFIPLFPSQCLLLLQISWKFVLYWTFPTFLNASRYFFLRFTKTVPKFCIILHFLLLLFILEGGFPLEPFFHVLIFFIIF